ncbi:hypothetical protein O3G_MSEX011111 [Manduca sexta]|uniref:Protein pellino n=1 Tax=Manduca sexta TaxID=7130 RepID=A0A921ZIZ9_MANSE|nr:hypothetical protein O3G_MSEX011111 [Manduca sexta]
MGYKCRVQDLGKVKVSSKFIANIKTDHNVYLLPKKVIIAYINLLMEEAKRLRLKRAADSADSPILEEAGESGSEQKPKPLVKYGELVILGYNGYLPAGERGRRRSKFVLYRRTQANGVRRSKHYVVKTPHSSEAILDASQHSISYTLNRNQAVIVEYMEDPDTDMFQEKATKWTENHEIDGLTTNGVLIMHPRGDFCGGSATCGPWRETSVGGAVFSLRESRSAQQKGLPCLAETNVLRDGTMIDLCGATLLWRSAEGLKNSPTKRDLEALVDELNAGRPQCPVGLNTLVIPRKLAGGGGGAPDLNQPYVYLHCGHVQGEHSWGKDGGEGSRRCPMCLTMGPVVRVCMGLEPAFYVDAAPPTYAFNPCGHMASERTVKYWASVDIPHGTNGFRAICPFCAEPLQGSPGYVRLIFQDNLD